jgi:hypothetical protein
MITVNRFERGVVGCCFLSLLILAGCTEGRRDLTPGNEETASVAGGGLSFSEWKDRVRLRGETGIYHVGDSVTPTIIVGEEDALAYYQRHVAKNAQALTLNNGQKLPGDTASGSYFPAGTVLTYCIDRTALKDVVARHTFMPSSTDLYALVDSAFGVAAASWNEVLGVNSKNVGYNTLEIRKAANRDNNCVPTPGDNITWYVRPAVESAPIEYMTYVLHPKYNMGVYGQSALDEAGLTFTEQLRELKIWEEILVEFSYADPQPFGAWFTLQGLMLHTIAQGLGFINENNRNDGLATIWNGDCRDPSVGGIFLTVADPYSVTVHPQSMKDQLANPKCVGPRPFDYAISYMDAMGAACMYRDKDAESLYYCNPGPQNYIQAGTGSCSPVPVEYSGKSKSDCGAPADWAGPAKGYGAALVSLLTSN